MKTCYVCNETKELHFYDKTLNPNTGTIYVRNTCRKCRNKRNQSLFFMRDDNLEKHYENTRKVFNRPEYKIYRKAIAALRNSTLRIQSSLNGNRKIPLLPKDIQLKEHLESLFDDKMNWQNCCSYWEVDHIESGIRLAKEGKTIDEINHLDNIRPLTKVENRSRARKNPDDYLIGIMN